MTDVVDMPPPGQGVPEYRRYGAGVNGINYDFYFFDKYVLPQEIIEWVAAGVDFGYHLVEVSAELVDTDLFAC